MVTFAQAQERAEEWINGDVAGDQRREVRVREFELGFVVWAEDRVDGPRADGGAQRLVIARDSGEASLWPALPVGEVIRRYEEEYGRTGAVSESAPPVPPARVDLHQTSFLLSPPGWLQEAADKRGISDRRPPSGGSDSEGSRGTGTDGAAVRPAAAADADTESVPDAVPEGDGAPPEMLTGSSAPADATPWPASAAVDKVRDAPPQNRVVSTPVGATPWTGTDIRVDAEEDRSVPLPETVFGSPLTDEEDAGTTLPGRAAPYANGSGAPPGPPAPPVPPGVPGPSQGAGAPAAPGAPGTPAAGTPVFGGQQGTPPPGAPSYGYPQVPGTPPAGAAGGPQPPGTPGTRPGSTSPPPGPGAQGTPAGGYVPTQLVWQPGPHGPEGAGGPATPGTPGAPQPPWAPAAPQPPGPPGAPGRPGTPGQSVAPGTPGAPQPPGAPHSPGAPPAPDAVHYAETVPIGPPFGAPGVLGAPQPTGPSGSPPGAPGPLPGQPSMHRQQPPAYAYPQQPPGQPTVGPGYQAVLRYRAPDGSEQQVIRRSAPGMPHPEWQIFHELRGMNIPPDQVLELHTELESCELPGAYCARMIREQWPNARITSIAPYGTDHASRQQGMAQLLAHQGELHQVADGPARPAPVRAPLPPVQPAPPIPPEAVAQELAAALGPNIFRFDQQAVSRQGVPPIVAHSLTVAGLPVDLGPFFWAQAQPGRPVPTLAELAHERGVQPASDAASYLVMGSDFGKAMCVQYGTAHIVAVPMEAGPGGAPVPPQFVNTGLPEFQRCLAMLARMWRLRYGLNQEQAGRWTVDFQAQLASLDPAALGSPESWWSVLLEQMWDGLL